MPSDMNDNWILGLAEWKTFPDFSRKKNWKIFMTIRNCFLYYGACGSRYDVETMIQLFRAEKRERDTISNRPQTNGKQTATMRNIFSDSEIFCLGMKLMRFDKGKQKAWFMLFVIRRAQNGYKVRKDKARIVYVANSEISEKGFAWDDAVNFRCKFTSIINSPSRRSRRDSRVRHRISTWPSRNISRSIGIV